MSVLTLRNLGNNIIKRLFIGARSVEKLEQVSKMCQLLGSECFYIQCDVTKEVDCKYNILIRIVYNYLEIW